MIPETKTALQTPANGTEEIAFTLRISRELNEKLLAEAEVKKRSRQGQIVYLLEKSFERREAENDDDF